MAKRDAGQVENRDQIRMIDPGKQIRFRNEAILRLFPSDQILRRRIPGDSRRHYERNHDHAEPHP